MPSPFSLNRCLYQPRYMPCRDMFIMGDQDWAFEEVTDHCRNDADWDRAYEFFTPFTH